MKAPRWKHGCNSLFSSGHSLCQLGEMELSENKYLACCFAVLQGDVIKAGVGDITRVAVGFSLMA
jgi:hypothetical protein